MTEIQVARAVAKLNLACKLKFLSFNRVRLTNNITWRNAYSFDILLISVWVPNVMQSNEQSFPSIDFQEEIARAKWFKEDLDKGGWREVYKGPVSNYWIKSFPKEKVPIKVLFTYDLPMPAKKCLQMLHPSTQDSRLKWDDVFVDLEILEAYPDGGFCSIPAMCNLMAACRSKFRVVLFTD